MALALPAIDRKIGSNVFSLRPRIEDVITTLRRALGHKLPKPKFVMLHDISVQLREYYEGRLAYKYVKRLLDIDQVQLRCAKCDAFASLPYLSRTKYLKLKSRLPYDPSKLVCEFCNLVLLKEATWEVAPKIKGVVGDPSLLTMEEYEYYHHKFKHEEGLMMLHTMTPEAETGFRKGVFSFHKFSLNTEFADHIELIPILRVHQVPKPRLQHKGIPKEVAKIFAKKVEGGYPRKIPDEIKAIVSEPGCCWAFVSYGIWHSTKRLRYTIDPLEAYEEEFLRAITNFLNGNWEISPLAMEVAESNLPDELLKIYESLKFANTDRAFSAITIQEVLDANKKGIS